MLIIKVKDMNFSLYSNFTFYMSHKNNQNLKIKLTFNKNENDKTLSVPGFNTSYLIFD